MTHRSIVAPRLKTFMPVGDNSAGPMYRAASLSSSFCLSTMYSRPVFGCTIIASASRGPSSYVTVYWVALTVRSASRFGSGSL